MDPCYILLWLRVFLMRQALHYISVFRDGFLDGADSSHMYRDA